MPKSQFYDPQKLLKRGVLTFADIPLFQYDRTLKQELHDHRFSADALKGIWRDMQWIREFETMLDSIRRTKEYRGIRHHYVGPAHLYIGEEAVAVGQAYHLTPDDFIFGNHRSHGETLAKGLRCIATMAEDTLRTIMENTSCGALYQVIRQHLPGHNVREDALHFFLYGLICELFGRANGFSRGLANSMHLFFPPFGIYPNNAIVGGSVGIATGAALYKKVNQKPGVCISNSGDGSLGCGVIWESMNFASMDQYHTLWDEAHRGGLPILYNIINNGYGMGGQTNGETMAYGILARMGAGISPTQLHAERINGFDPLAVIDAYARKLPLLREGQGPVMLDVLTYRTCGHSVSDHGSYRTQEEVDIWANYDCIAGYRQQLVDAGLACEEELDHQIQQMQDTIATLLRLAVDDQISPRLESHHIGDYIFSNGHRKRMAEGPVETLLPYEQVPQVQQLRQRRKNGTFSYRDAIFEAILQKFYEDSTLVAYGEENRDWGGQFGVYQGLTEALPYHRLFNAPISEAAIVSTAVGYGISGGRCIIDLAFCDFMGRAGDELFNQLAKWQAMSAGMLTMPVVVRVALGTRYGAQHSQDWTSLPAHIPGLKVVFPATPYDAKGLMNAALAGTDPVIFFESQRLYNDVESYHDEVPEEYYEIPLGEPILRQTGKDLTILTLGSTLHTAECAADALEKRWGLEVEIIDVRSLVPFNYTPVLASIHKTGRVLLVSDACERGSHMSDLAQNLTQFCFTDLKAPPLVLGARNWITPGPDFEKDFFPQPEWLLDAIHQHLIPLPGHTCSYDFSREQMIAMQKRGI